MYIDPTVFADNLQRLKREQKSIVFDNYNPAVYKPKIVHAFTYHNNKKQMEGGGLEDIELQSGERLRITVGIKDVKINLEDWLEDKSLIVHPRTGNIEVIIRDTYKPII